VASILPWSSDVKPAPHYYVNSERVLVARLRGGSKLIGYSYHDGDCVEAERQDVIAYCVEQGSIQMVGTKPARYELTEHGWTMPIRD
jgi:hypothetical protein